MDSSPQSTPSTGVDETSAGFASSSERTGGPRVLPVIVQPVVPETTGAIASQAIASVPRPNEGTIRVIDTAGLAELNFNFPTSEVHIAALDVDLVMVFADSSKLILPGLAVGLLGANPPKLNFLGKSVSAQSVISAISQVTLAESAPSIQLSSAEFLPKKPSGPAKGDQESATGHDGVGGGEPPLPPQPIVSGGKFDKQSQASETKTGDFSTPPVKEVTAGSLSQAAANSAIASPSVVTPAKNIDENQTKSSFAFDSVVTGQLFQTVGTSVSGNSIKGATGTGSADTNPDFAVQNAKEVLTGSASGDEIWGEDPSSYPTGMAGRSLQITLPSTSVTVSTVTISGIPDSVKILNATYIGGGIYKMAVGTGNSFTMKLAYKLPTNDTQIDSDKFYDGFKYTFSFEFAGVNAKGEKGTVSASATVGVRDVTSAAEQISLDPNTGKLMVSLSRDPTGNIVNAGDGNDTVHGAAGADLIDGGDGRDRVVYDLSHDGVSVNLATGTGDKGFARGDTYINVEDIIGSDYNDTLIGDAQDNQFSGGKGDDSLSGGAGRNTLVGGAGADTLDGTDGTYDLADYSGSSSGVTVDLGAGTGSGGDAAGDRLKNIEAVIGSAQADFLIAGASGSSIHGGDGNDTLVGGGGADSLFGGTGNDSLRLDWSSINYRIDGGAGNDTVSFAGSTTNTSLSGSSFSNLLSNAEYLDFSGTAGNVSLTLGGDDIQKILTGSSSASSNAGVLDLKFDTSGDSLTLAANASYSYWQTSDVNATTGQIAGGSSFSVTGGTNSYVYVFDANHTTLLATLHYQV